MNTKKYPVEVWDTIQGCCYVDSLESKKRFKKDAMFGENIAGQWGETQDVLIDGKVVGYRFFAYDN